MTGAADLAAMGARLAAAGGVDPPPVVVVRPAPRGGRRSLASARLGTPATIAVTEQAAAGLPPWRLEVVLAHELGHVGQDRRRLEGAQLVAGGGLVASGLAAGAALAGLPGATAGLAVAAVVTLLAGALFLRDSKLLEYEADRFGARLVGPAAMADHLDRVAREHHELPGFLHLVVAHPPSRRRAARLRT